MTRLLGVGVRVEIQGSVNDLSDMFQTGVIPAIVPEPATPALAGLAAAALVIFRRRRVE
jgi:hypothetical protein